MTKLSVNMNKIALLRNARGRNFPNVVAFAQKFIDLGVQGITVHPRQDERHITIEDTLELARLLSQHPAVEFNVEGYPSEAFLRLVERVRPAQCTLVPDSPDQLTSDHGWNLAKDRAFVKQICSRLSKAKIRSAIFLDPDLNQLRLAKTAGTDRIELYTELYAAHYGTAREAEVYQRYALASLEAQKLGLGVNAGHDLGLLNLRKFLSIGSILEVSIGHALTVECIEQGMKAVVKQYLALCKASA